jgi:hypothetical protein
MSRLLLRLAALPLLNLAGLPLLRQVGRAQVVRTCIGDAGLAGT